VLDGEIQCLDALQILLVDIVLAAGSVGLCGTQELSHDGDRSFEHVVGRHAYLSTLRQQVLAQVWIDQREEHQSGFLADVFQCALQLALAANQRVEMFVDGHAFELSQRRARDGIQGFAGGVGDQMDMKFPAHRFTLKFVPSYVGSSTKTSPSLGRVHPGCKPYNTLGTNCPTLRPLRIYQALERKRLRA